MTATRLSCTDRFTQRSYTVLHMYHFSTLQRLGLLGALCFLFTVDLCSIADVVCRVQR